MANVSEDQLIPVKSVLCALEIIWFSLEILKWST